MRISDWSSDVCSSDLAALEGREDDIGATLDDLATLVGGLASRDDAIQRLITNLDVVAETVNRRDAQIETMLTNLIALSDSSGDNTATPNAALVELGPSATETAPRPTGNATENDPPPPNLAPA